MKKILSVLIVFIFGAALFGVSIFSKQNVETELEGNDSISDYSEVLAENYKVINEFYEESFSENGLDKEQYHAYKKMDNTYAVGKNIAISNEEIQQYADFYTNEGYSEEEAYAAARKDAEERNALYVEAMKNGYSVTDDEVYEWLDELRAGLEEDTTGVYQAAMEGFESEEAYWDFEFEVYKIDLPIQKYVSAKEQEFYKNNPEASETDIPYNSWHDAFEELKEELASAQNFQVLH